LAGDGAFRGGEGGAADAGQLAGGEDAGSARLLVRVDGHGLTTVGPGRDGATGRDRELEVGSEAEADADGVDLDPTLTATDHLPLLVEARHGCGLDTLGAVRRDHRPTVPKPDPMTSEQTAVPDRLPNLAPGN
jgi:hypothetical protein